MTKDNSQQDEAMGHQSIIGGFLAAAIILLMAVIGVYVFACGIDRWMMIKWGF